MYKLKYIKETILKMNQLPVQRWDMSVPYEKEVKTDWAQLLGSSQSKKEAVLDWDAFMLPSLLGPSECESIVASAEELGFGRTDYPKAYRGNLRLLAHDASLAAALWPRIAPHVAPTLPDFDGSGRTWHAVGLNDLFRLAKYFPGDCFGQVRFPQKTFSDTAFRGADIRIPKSKLQC